MKSFRQAIVSNYEEVDHYYSISSRDSLTTPEQYLAFMENEELSYEVVDSFAGTSLTVKVEEDLYDPNKLLMLMKKRLFGCGVKIKLNMAASESDLINFDFTVIATYGRLNKWNKKAQDYQFELCEKPVYRLPNEYQNKSIIDGDYVHRSFRFIWLSCFR